LESTEVKSKDCFRERLASNPIEPIQVAIEFAFS